MGMDIHHAAEQTDVAVIGGGPSGLFAAFYCGMRGLSCRVIESLPQLGGQLTALYPEKFIYDVAGFSKIRAGDLIERLKEQMMQFEPDIRLSEQVLKLEKLDERLFALHTTKGMHTAKAVIICGGIGMFTPRKLPAAEAADFEGRGIDYLMQETEAYRDKRVLVVGGGDSAVDYALMLEPVARQVTLIHRRDQFRAHEHSVRRLHDSSINVHVFTELQAIHGGDRVEGATLLNNRTKETREIAVDVILSGLGFSASLGPMKTWGLKIEGNEIVVNSRMETNVPGVFAVGDINTYPGKVKLIVAGFGEATIAVNHAKTYIDPSARTNPGHSSSRTDMPVDRVVTGSR
ncbi:NAD(P)/FAD-dependent oxidoreductase [Kyrpidia tusciae]|uniref:Ferredoxin--NADP reductase n=1 Tax=Kyrpidia tusciae (strain DSM 2912 / NBRC 15312 / T2) TaxID=562970 RepID=D5WV39_KYRT2|nr:FAD-dependent pyridine nucleotide-disulfide oxidoreductase [Kyrpidia tusciae DSM 2912]